MRPSSCHNIGNANTNLPDNTGNQTILNVVPLNSIPYIGPSTGQASMSGHRANDNVEKRGPAMIFLPCESAPEFTDLANQTKTGVALTGSAAMGKIGPTIGLVDIAENEDSFYFRVSLPGVSGDEKEFSCEVDPDGKILIKGVTTTGEKTVCKHSQVFRMLTQNLCPPGHFTISFQLPGPVDNDEFVGQFGSDGVLVGTVKKI
ncbi:PREDICTED: alpha-crystallin domain-containing protein 22.3-like [Tarenaya hassleriana]|uniref:alpha-crystallin domain-containing protein 22.3-like n=1 Tax=Tarenaya hassleriana TaxID=28532 RepID=UPI00053C098D|nr:PREDICTED: alpha-crystallin domain-containing protein 22.3-like [Tarenaya hassleriana]